MLSLLYHEIACAELAVGAVVSSYHVLPLQALKPEYAKAATTLKSQGSDVVLAKVSQAMRRKGIKMRVNKDARHADEQSCRPTGRIEKA